MCIIIGQYINNCVCQWKMYIKWLNNLNLIVFILTECVRCFFLIMFWIVNCVFLRLFVCYLCLCNVNILIIDCLLYYINGELWIFFIIYLLIVLVEFLRFTYEFIVERNVFLSIFLLLILKLNNNYSQSWITKT